MKAARAGFLAPGADFWENSWWWLSASGAIRTFLFIMQQSGRTDPELLAEWLESGSEAAFQALVTRYAGLVLMTARRTCGDDSLAREASQLSFILLARKAKALTACPTLGGWLHRTTLMQCRNLLRASRREDRKRHHLQAAMKHTPSTAAESAGVWMEMQPVLDEALGALSDRDREVLLLRFYRSLSIREVAETLSIAVDAAQKRIDRATGRLRSQLARRGCQTASVTLGTALLAGFTADAKAASPFVPLFTSKALAAVAIAGGAFGATAVTAFITTVAMKSTTIILPAVAVLATAWIAIQQHSISGLEEKNVRLEKQVAALPVSASSSSPTGGASASSRSRSSNSSSTRQAGKQQDEDAWVRMAPGPQRAKAVEDRAALILAEKNPSRRLLLFSRFIGSFDADDFEAVAASFAAHDQQGRLFPSEYDLFLSTAAMVGGEKAMNKIFPPDYPFSNTPFGAQHSAMSAWAMEDPQGAAEWWNRLPDSTVKNELARSLIGGIASTAPDYAWQILHEFPAERRPDFMRSMVQQQITDQGAEAAVQWMGSLQLPDGSTSDLAALKRDGFQQLFGTLVNLSPDKKSEFINRFAGEEWMQQSPFPSLMAGSWAQQNPAEAVGWADGLPGGARLNAVLSALSTWQQKNNGEYEAWKSSHAEDPAFQDPIRAVDEFARARQQQAKENR